jgi:hypothetical protein
MTSAPAVSPWPKDAPIALDGQLRKIILFSQIDNAIRFIPPTPIATSPGSQPSDRREGRARFNLWPEHDDAGRFKVPMLSRWRTQEQHSGETGLPQIQYAFLELPKYAAGDAPRTLTDRWAYFFREAKNLSVVPPALSEEPFRGALEVTRMATFSSEEWEAYERAKMAEQDARGALTVARQEGVADGKRAALLLILTHAGISLTEDVRARTAACADVATLDRWLASALGAKSAADVFAR